MHVLSVCSFPRSQDIRKRINAIPPLGKLAQFVAIPTTSGTGSEVTPFAVVTDQVTGIKYPLADYALVSAGSAAGVVTRQFQPVMPAGVCRHTSLGTVER